MQITIQTNKHDYDIDLDLHFETNHVASVGLKQGYDEKFVRDYTIREAEDEDGNRYFSENALEQVVPNLHDLINKELF